MTPSGPLLLRVLALPFLLGGLGAVGSGCFLVVSDLSVSGEAFDGLGTALGLVAVVGGLPLVVLASVVLLARDPRVAGGAGCVLGALTSVAGVLARDALGTWTALVAAAGATVLVASVLALRGDDGPARRPTPEVPRRA